MSIFPPFYPSHETEIIVEDKILRQQSYDKRSILSQDFPGGPVVKTLPSNAGGVGSVPGGRAKISHASQTKTQNIKQKQHCNKFNKKLKNDPQLKKKKKRYILSWMYAVVFPVFLVLLPGKVE